ncbi:hypothetical protein BDV06DRAFT_221202 [Aspergillus oleicola]
MDTTMDPRLDGLPESSSPLPQPKRRAPKLRRRGQPPPEWAPEDLTHSRYENEHEMMPAIPSRPGEWDHGYPDADPESEIGRSSSGDNSSNHQQITRQTTVVDESPDNPDEHIVQFNDVQDTVSPDGNLVRDVSHKTVGSVGETTQGLVGAVSSTTNGVTGHDNEQLKLRLDLNLDVELQLKAKIKGDLTLQLMYALLSLFVCFS